MKRRRVLAGDVFQFLLLEFAFSKDFSAFKVGNIFKAFFYEFADFLLCLGYFRYVFVFSLE